jgi:hypothetical protein
MYCRQRRHLYFRGENLKYYLTPSSHSSSFPRGQRLQPIQMGHIRERGVGGVDNFLCLWAYQSKHWALTVRTSGTFKKGI